MLNVYFKVIDEVTRPILLELRGARHNDIKCWFKESDKESVAFIRDLQLIQHKDIDKSVGCYNWDIEACNILPEYDGLEHLVWRSINETTAFVCIDSSNHCGNELVLFQDATHKTELPQAFVKIPCFGNYEDLIEYADSKGVFSFSLSNPTRFEKCSGIGPFQGAPVYREKITGRYWYKDMLHKTHYEVFDSNGVKHLGEANMDGVLDEGKKDKSKKAII
ncbi:MAG: hypothetical protein ACRCZY_06710 [Phocaeicola sp.]